jgi:hypothetical protein
LVAVFFQHIKRLAWQRFNQICVTDTGQQFAGSSGEHILVKIVVETDTVPEFRGMKEDLALDQGQIGHMAPGG